MKHLTYLDRLKIEDMYNKLHLNKYIIADTLGVCRQTIYNELNRGFVTILDKNYCYKKVYSADIAQKKVDFNNSSKGANIKLGKDYSFCEFIRHCIIVDKYSPAVALQLAKSKNFNCNICTTTLYSYIDKGYIFGVSRKNLPLQRKKRKYNKVSRHRIQNVLYPSIDDRPKGILNRDSFGHWELDTVIGKHDGSRSCLMVLTERKTRYEIIMKLNDKSQLSVLNAFNKLERIYPNFKDIFKTITCDNGGEFSPSVIENSIYGGKRTLSFFCHPYCSCERGSNENANKLIRRHIPKGNSIAAVSDEQILYIENWMNKLPRKILNWQTAETLFNAEISSL